MSARLATVTIERSEHRTVARTSWARSARIILSFGACWSPGGHKKGPPLRNSTRFVYPVAFRGLSSSRAQNAWRFLRKVFQSKSGVSKIVHFSLNFDRRGPSLILRITDRVTRTTLHKHARRLTFDCRTYRCISLLCLSECEASHGSQSSWNA